MLLPCGSILSNKWHRKMSQRKPNQRWFLDDFWARIKYESRNLELSKKSFLSKKLVSKPKCFLSLHPSLFSIVVIKCSDQKQIGEKTINRPTCPHHSLSLKEPGQELKAGSRSPALLQRPREEACCFLSMGVVNLLFYLTQDHLLGDSGLTSLTADITEALPTGQSDSLC